MSDTAGTPTAEGTHPDGTGRPATSSDRAPWIAAAIALVVVVIDQLSKLWAEQNLELGTRTPVLGDALGIQLAYNPGAAFSLGEDVTWIFTILAGLAMLGIGWFVLRVRSRLWAVCLGLLLGGAVTHFGDRLLRAPSFGQGHVVDFIAYFDWFIGNVADIALFVGAVVLFALTIQNVPLRPVGAGHTDTAAGGTPAS